MGGDKCMYRGCQNMRNNSLKIFYPFPTDEVESMKRINSGKYLNNSCTNISVLVTTYNWLQYFMISNIFIE